MTAHGSYAGKLEASRRYGLDLPPPPKDEPTGPIGPVVDSGAAALVQLARQTQRRPEPDRAWPDTGQGQRSTTPSVENPGTVEARRRWPHLDEDND